LGPAKASSGRTRAYAGRLKAVIGKRSSWPRAIEPLWSFVAFTGVTAEVVPAKGGGQHGTKIE